MFAKVIIIMKLAVILLCILSHIEAQLEEWKIPCNAIYKPKNCENASVETLSTVEDFERCAPARLEPSAREFVWSGAGRGITLFENKEAYRRIWIKTKVLRGISKYSLETSVLGRKIGFPLGIAPIGGQTFYHPEGERGTARGAASLGVVMVLDAHSLLSLEDVKKAAPQADLWMQTYMFPNRKLVASIVGRAERAGFRAIVVTADVPYGSDVRCNSRPWFFGKIASEGNPNFGTVSRNDTVIDTTFTFKDITWLTGITTLPIVAKGILTVEDAIQAIEAGASAIVVSNHGGRELDGTLPSIDALPEIARAVKSQCPWVDVYVDGGIRTGHDIFKALARGAKAAFIGRPAIWGLAMGGEKGVNKVLTILREEFKNALIHAGYSDPSQITSSSVISKWIYTDYPSGEL